MGTCGASPRGMKFSERVNTSPQLLFWQQSYLPFPSQNKAVGDKCCSLLTSSTTGSNFEFQKMLKPSPKHEAGLQPPGEVVV